MCDLISRQSVLDMAYAYGNGYEPEGFCVEVEDIQSLPSVQSERSEGEWINDGIYAEGHSERAYRCSVCNEQFIGYIGEYNYCPNCGADMKKVN